MKPKIWLRIPLFILGVMAIFLLLTMGNVHTKKIHVAPGNLINIETLGDQLYLLKPDWQESNTEERQIYKTEFHISTSNSYSGIYLPRAEDIELLINGSTDGIIKDYESLLYLFEPKKNDQTISIEIRLPASSHEMYSTTQLYIGNYDSIMFVKYREINLRLFIIGLSFTIILISISLFIQKPSEKYLMWLALLAFSTFGYVLLKAYPFLQENFWTSLMLFGPIKLPLFSMDTSNLLYRLFYPVFVGFINYLLIKNFVSVKIFNLDYFFFILPISLFTLIFIGDYRYSGLLLLHRIYINLLESIVIIKGHYTNKNDTVLLLMGAISATGLNIFIAASGANIIPHGDVDLLFRLGGVYASSYPIAFTIATNGIFARKYAESEMLSKELNHVNKNLQKIVNERTVELKTAYKNLEKEQQLKDIFITNMVHSLKTPLFSIAGFADMAQEALHSAPEKVSHFIYLIISNTDFVVKLVNNLFLALRLESGKVNYMIEKANICKMMEQIYNTTLPQSQEKDIHIHMDIPEHPVIVECDFYYLTLAVQNIVDNAVRHTQNGGIIGLSITDMGEDVLILIKDNGEGISDEVIDHIFERYYSHSLQGHESSGLGLTISQDVISTLKGQISVNSIKGKGTEFVIVLPKTKTSAKWINKNRV